MNNSILRSALPYSALAALLVFCTASLAQVPQDRDALLNADGMNQASFAEMNGYPGPKYVLDLADKLNLTAEQRKSVQESYTEMITRAKELGKQIVGIEKELNDAFAQGFVNQKSVGNDAEEIGRLRGRLRAIYLVAFMKTKAALNESQIALYRKLRSATKQTKH